MARNVAAYAAMGFYVAVILANRLGLSGAYAQGFEAAASLTLIALVLAYSWRMPASRQWLAYPLAGTGMVLGGFWLLELIFGPALNPLAPSPGYLASNTLLVLPGYLAPSALGLLLLETLQRGRRVAAAASAAAFLAALASSPPTITVQGFLAVAASVFVAAAALASGQAGGAVAGLLAAAGLTAPLVLSPVVPAARGEVLYLVYLAAAATLALWAYTRTAPQPPPAQRGTRPNALTPLAVAAAALALVAAMHSGYYILAVATGSMEPVIEPGDLVLVAPLDGSPQPGTIVAYTDPQSGSVVVHRVVDTSGGMFVARGDANEAPDPPAPLEAILGRVALRVPRLGWPYLALAEATGSPLAASMVLALLAAATMALARRR